MTVQVPVRLTEEDVALLDALVAAGEFDSRSDALRAGLAHVIREAEQRKIDAAYREGYRKHPQERWVGLVGLAGLAAFDRAEGGEPL